MPRLENRYVKYIVVVVGPTCICLTFSSHPKSLHVSREIWNNSFLPQVRIPHVRWVGDPPLKPEFLHRDTKLFSFTYRWQYTNASNIVEVSRHCFYCLLPNLTKTSYITSSIWRKYWNSGQVSVIICKVQRLNNTFVHDSPICYKSECIPIFLQKRFCISWLSNSYNPRFLLTLLHKCSYDSFLQNCLKVI